jgi:ElaB/YqjD/DUF883 family membrane-anchored ribosome-binding protein
VSRDTETFARVLHGRLLSSQLAGNVLAAAPFSGQTADHFRAAVSSIGAGLVAARDSHELVAQALRRVAEPIEDEQRARTRLRNARKQLAEAREQLSNRKSDLSTAQRELTAAAGELVAQRTWIAIAEAANLVRAAAGTAPVPVDTAALHAAEQRLSRAERTVNEAEQLVTRAAHRADEAADRADRARRAHDDMQQARDIAVSAFAATCHAARVCLSLPITNLGPVELGPFAHADAGTEKLHAFARAQLDLLQLKHSITDGVSTVDLQAWGGTRAGASGGVRIGPDGVGAKISGGGFVGTEASATGTIGDDRTVTASAGGSARFGAGADAHANASYEDGKLTVDVGAGAALGPGGKLTGEITINPGGIVKSLLDAPRNYDRTIGRIPGL